MTRSVPSRYASDHRDSNTQLERELNTEKRNLLTTVVETENPGQAGLDTEVVGFVVVIATAMVALGAESSVVAAKTTKILSALLEGTPLRDDKKSSSSVENHSTWYIPYSSSSKRYLALLRWPSIHVSPIPRFRHLWHGRANNSQFQRRTNG